MKKTYSAYAAAAIAGGAVLTTAGPAHAATVIDCTNATNVPNPVYIAGSSASKPLLISLAATLGNTVSIIYAAPASCNGLADVTTPQAESTTPTFLSPSGTAYTCQGAGGTTYGAFNVDIGVADVYPSSCITPQITLGASQKDFHGAIQPMEIVVPFASSENSISAEAAYVVFGFDAASMYTVMPWNDPTAIWTRGDTSGTQVMIANAIGLSAAKWLSNTGDAGAAQIQGGSGSMATAVVAGGVSKPNSTIGILSAGTADPLRGAAGTNDAGATTDGMKPLAFQATNQDCGYYPDSDLTHFDKINVRQGRYAIWGPLHFVVNTDGSGNPIATTLSNPVASTNASVATLVNAFIHNGLTATSTPSLQTVIKAETSAHFVPDCAMQVSRSTEIGGEASYQPTGACGCYFESLTGGGTTLSSYCQTCTADADCADAGAYTHCNYGYCEAK
jgi:hypothetical protein